MAEQRPTGSTTTPRSSRSRPQLARLLDRLSLLGADLAGRLLRRPSDELLSAMARADRPGLRGIDERSSVAERAEVAITTGRAAFAAGQHAEALHHFSLAVSLAPESAWAWHGRGDALQLMGQPEAALAAYQKARALAPETGLHHAGAANALAALERPDEADSAWQEALSRDPSLHWMRERG